MSGLMTVGELARVLSASAIPTEVHGDARVGFSSVSTDSRTLSADALFVALSGERFNGHDYVARAHENGAVAALVERRVDVDVPQLIVADSKRASASPRAPGARGSRCRSFPWQVVTARQR